MNTHTHTVASEHVTHKDDFGTRIVQECTCGKIRIREIQSKKYGFTVADRDWQSPTPSADSDS